MFSAHGKESQSTKAIPTSMFMQTTSNKSHEQVALELTT